MSNSESLKSYVHLGIVSLNTEETAVAFSVALGHEAVDKQTRNAMVRQGLSIGVSLIPFGLAFGVSCTKAGLSWVQSLAFSSLVFTGGSQFAAVGVLGDGGGAVAAIGAGLLLSIRSLVYGLVMAPILKGRFAYRAAASQLMIDESIAVSTSQTTPSARRMGYFVGGLSVFFFWNLTTVIGAVALKSNGDLVTKFGLDATVPAAFAALLWPRLRDPENRRVALVGALIALVLIPIAPAGMPIVASGFAVGVAFLKLGRGAGLIRAQSTSSVVEPADAGSATPEPRDA
jgi:predicted branched-subunit amino acid permease